MSLSISITQVEVIGDSPDLKALRSLNEASNVAIAVVEVSDGTWSGSLRVSAFPLLHSAITQLYCLGSTQEVFLDLELGLIRGYHREGRVTIDFYLERDLSSPVFELECTAAYFFTVVWTLTHDLAASIESLTGPVGDFLKKVPVDTNCRGADWWRDQS
jgi:hypothetical protein